MKDILNLPSKKDIHLVLNLEDKKLPAFPQVATKLLEALRRDTASVEELSKIVETDPGLSVSILEIVNSTACGLDRKITTLSEAMVYMGMDEIKTLAIGMIVFDKLFKNGRSKAFDRILFWRHCLSVAVLSSKIAKDAGYPEPEEAYIAGLLHDAGKIFLDLKGRKNYGKFITTLNTSTDLVIEKERNEIGLGHDDIGAYLCVLWKLPDSLALVVKYHHLPFGHLDISSEQKQLISIVSLANFLCWTQGIGSFDFIRPSILAPEIEQFTDPNKIDIFAAINHMNQEIEKISAFYQFIFPSAEKLKQNLLEASLKLSRLNTRYYYQEDPWGRIKTEARDQAPANTANMDLELGKSLARAKSLKEVLDILMYQIGNIFEPHNWSILLKDQKTSELSFSLVVGVNKDKLEGIKLKKGEGIAGHVMETAQSLIVEDVTKDDHFSSRVDHFTGFNTKSIIATPLKTGDKIFGVIELINRINDAPFSDQDLSLLSDLGEYAAIAIERAYYNQALTKLATKDAVTGLKNRWSFDRIISSKKQILKNYGPMYSVLIIDIQGVRALADKPAHQNIDTALKNLADVMANTKRHEDDLYRYGENTFVIILPRTNSDSAQIVKDRMSSQLNPAISENGEPLLKINMVAYTFGVEDFSHLKTKIDKFLSKSIVNVKDSAVGDFEKNLNEMVEEGKKQQQQEEEQKKIIGKAVSLNGRFSSLKTCESGYIKVEQLSLDSIGIRISRSHRIRVNDFLDIHFTLDNSKKTLIERRIVVRDIKGNYVAADFYNPPPYAADLGFYLMS